MIHTVLHAGWDNSHVGKQQKNGKHPENYEKDLHNKLWHTAH